MRAAVKSATEFSRISGLTLGYLRNYSAETANAEQIEAAMSMPGKVFWKLEGVFDEKYREKS